MGKGELKIVNGKFVRDGVEVKPEFGNREQIVLIRKTEEEMERGWVIADIVNVTRTMYKASIDYVCLECGCDQSYEFDDEQEDWEWDGPNFNKETIECESCGAEYECEWDKDTGIRRNQIKIKRI